MKNKINFLINNFKNKIYKLIVNKHRFKNFNNKLLKKAIFKNKFKMNPNN